MSSALTGKLKAFVLGSPNAKKVYQNLQAADIPVTTAECRSCADPCDQDHDDFSSRLDIDMDSDMLGSVKPYHRQVVISTGKTDWANEVTEAEGTLAAFLNTVNTSLGTSKKPKSNNGSSPPGVFSHTEAGRLAILNGSHKPFSHDESEETVIVLPDFMVVSGVPRTLAGAEALWKAAVDPSLDRAGVTTRTDNLNTWVLPYSCLILLCSHKRRDKRCAVAAPILEQAFHQYLEREGWEVHTDLHDLTSEPSLESQASSTTEKGQLIETQLKSLQAEHKALILKNSHVGGHKFAGNCIIYTPRGAGVWYGRVTPHEVESIVKHTIIDGQVLPIILRGGVDLACRGKKSLYDW
ncbi:Sucrase/ferredoxin-like-domain-containing protein [Suillus clintonianus]|uniref:Sucrase/ferredoxin-like-domain-containing protein n=1 Tax=Suillus clintonianus TaxID=1904413 RepID=UPI001B867224|nr:Sucrase/ferredoxin-like-domain-containing protein [Suillus clintonianus]KAG2152938.1 Sucrase/ferredoxin-like-domain-containing protein [Suillus clintonianus]